MPLTVRNNVVWAPDAKKTSGAYTGGPPKALLHATIAPSTVLPGYRYQSTAPHETLLWNRTTKVLSIRTHLYFNQYAKALANPEGGVQTNKDSVLQWELAGYLGRGTPSGQFNILTAPNVYWEQVADAIGPIVRSWKIAPTFSRSFAAGVSEDNRARRMTGSEWDAFNGICTHADAAENNHWDSPLGPIVAGILKGKIWPLATPILPAYGYIPFPFPATHYIGRFAPGVERCHSGTQSATDRLKISRWQRAMNRYQNTTLAYDGIYGPASEASCRAMQKRKTLAITGRVNPATWLKTWNK